MNLSVEQQKIIDHREGALLVIAAAGSGKTRVLTERIKSLLNEPKVRFHVLALTFTNKAAEEMKERLTDVTDIDKRAYIGTIHSFCLEVLEQHGYAIDMPQIPQLFERQEDLMALIMQVYSRPGNEDLMQVYQSRDTRQQQQLISNSLNYISSKKKNLKGVEAFNILDKDIDNESRQRLFDDYNLLLHQQGAMDFDDVIINAYRILAERPKVARLYQRQYKYIAIDEAQDLNFAQYELLKILCGNECNNVLMVGDTKQSLYHFNGSDIKMMKELFVRDFNAQKIELNTNFRSADEIIKAANKVNASSMKVFEQQGLKGQVNIWPCNNEKEEASRVINEVQSILNKSIYKEGEFEEEIKTTDIAILARSRYLLDNVEKYLLESNIPFQIKSSITHGDWDSCLIRIFDLGLRIIAHPSDELHFNVILNELGIKDHIFKRNYTEGLHKLSELESAITQENIKQYKAVLKAWSLASDKRFNLSKAFDHLEEYAKSLKPEASINANEVEEAFSKYGNPEEIPDDAIQEIIADIERYRELWRTYARNTPFDQKNLQHFKIQISLGTILPKKEANGITLSTIHQAKGLEYKVVFLVGLDQGSLPYYKSLKARGAKLREEQNIFYVGITRAKRLLYISYPENRFMPWDMDKPRPQKPSEYLKLLND